MDKAWRLGDDLSVNDNMLDGFTFEDIITIVKCNCHEITLGAIRREIVSLLELRLGDMKCLLEKNMDVIVEEAMKGRCL